MKRRQITALVLACMLSLSSVTAYADNEAETESVTEMSAEDGDQEAESESIEDVETDALPDQESEEAQAEGIETDTEEESEAMTDNAENESEAIEEETEAASEDDESESEDIAVGGLEATVEDSETEEADAVEEESEAVTEDIKPESETIVEEEAEAVAEDTETESGTVLEEESEAVSEDTETEPETVMEEAETVIIYANMISPREDTTYYVPIFEGTNQFTLTYPEGVTESDIVAMSFALLCEGTTCSSIENLPFIYDRYNELFNWGYIYDGNVEGCIGNVTENGFEIQVNNENTWLGILRVDIICKDGRIYTDGVETNAVEGYCIYEGVYIYLEKGQTVNLAANEVGFCQGESIGDFIKCESSEYNNDSDTGYQYPTIDMKGLTIQKFTTGFVVRAEEIGDYIDNISFSCWYSDVKHFHNVDIIAVVSATGRGEREPGLYDCFGNLIRSFEKSQAPADETSETEEETIVDTVDKSENSAATEKEEEASEKDDTTSTNSTNSAASSDSSTSKVDSPATGDSDAMRIIFLMISLTCCISFALETKKRLSGKH